MSGRDPKNSRGFRNKNPGNIDFNPRNNWQGQIGREQGPGARFAVFESHEFGIRALIALLTTYQMRHKLRTIDEIINRWAPPDGVSPSGATYTQNTNGYAAHVSRLTGFARNQRLDLRTYEHARPLVEAIITHELGGQPYDSATIDRGLELYGVVKGAARPVETIGQAAQTGTGRGAIQAAAATGAVAVAVQAAPAVSALQGLDWRVGVAIVVAAAVGAVVFILAKRKT